MKYLSVLILLFLQPCISWSQTLLHLKQNPDPSVNAMGGCLSYGTLSYASFGNVAMVPFEESNSEFGLGTLWLHPGVYGSNLMTAAGSLKPSSKFGVSFGLAYVLNQKYDIISTTGMESRMYRPYDALCCVGVSYKFWDFMAAGVKLSYAKSMLAPESGYDAIASDLYVEARYKSLKATLGLQGLGWDWSESAVTTDVPLTALLSVAYDYTFQQQHKVAVTAQTEVFMDSDISTSCGLLYSYKDWGACRVGYRYNSYMSSSVSVGLSGGIAGFSLGTSYTHYLQNEFLTGIIALSVTMKI